MNGPMFFLLVQKTAGLKHDLQKYNFVFFRQFKQDLLLFITLLQFQHTDALQVGFLSSLMIVIKGLLITKRRIL